VLAILKDYYATLADRVEVPLHKHARGDR